MIGGWPNPGSIGRRVDNPGVFIKEIVSLILASLPPKKSEEKCKHQFIQIKDLVLSAVADGPDALSNSTKECIL